MNFWYCKKWYIWIFIPFSLLYWLISSVRKFMYQKNIFTSYKSPVPVIIVGNINVGGTGKTPVVIWLVKQLQYHGIKVGVISRGYGGKNTNYPLLVSKDSNPNQTGDEPLLIVNQTDVNLVVSPNRKQAIELLLKTAAVDIIISDDGLQHYALQRDFELVVIDGKRRFGNGFLLPTGPLREPVSRLKSVDAVICNGGKADKNEIQMSLKAQYAVNLVSGATKLLTEFSNNPQDIIAIAGIGNPSRFFDMLTEYKIEPKQTYAFADHHKFVANDLATILEPDQILLMTEKDAVKCKEFAASNYWYIPVVCNIIDPRMDSLMDKIINQVKETQYEH